VPIRPLMELKVCEPSLSELEGSLAHPDRERLEINNTKINLDRIGFEFISNW